MAAIPASADPYLGAVGERVLYAAGRRAIRREAELSVTGLDLLPAGPSLIVANHVHHKLDGCALMTVMPRPFRAVVTVDWAEDQSLPRTLLERGCRALRWPTVLRERAAAADPQLAASMLRQAMRDSLAVLRAGDPLLIFPEGYPFVDPQPTPKLEAGQLLPFQQGAARIALMALRSGVSPLPVVPLGFSYSPLGRGRWRIGLTFGEPFEVSPEERPEALTARMEASVRALVR